MRKKFFTAVLAVTFTIGTLNISNAAAQRFTFKLQGQCAETATMGTIEENVTNSCRIDVTINPAKPFRVINLQYKDEAGKWQFANDDYGDKINMKSGASKRVEVQIPSFDEDGVFYDFPSREFRVYMPKAAAAPAAASKPFVINYTPEGSEGEEVDPEAEG